MNSNQEIQWIKDPKGDLIDEFENPEPLQVYKKMAPNAPNLRLADRTKKTCCQCVSIKPVGEPIDICVRYGLYYNWLDERFHKIKPFSTQLICDSFTDRYL